MSTRIPPRPERHPFPPGERDRERLLRYCHSLARNAALAEDLCQEACARALERARQLRNPERFRPWLFRTARNLYLDYAKSPRNARRVSLEEVPEAALGEGSPPPSDRDRAVQAALAELRERDRDIILAIYLEGLTCAQAAELLGETERAVRGRLQRARGHFKRRIRQALGRR